MLGIAAGKFAKEYSQASDGAVRDTTSKPRAGTQGSSLGGVQQKDKTIGSKSSSSKQLPPGSHVTLQKNQDIVNGHQSIEQTFETKDTGEGGKSDVLRGEGAYQDMDECASAKHRTSSLPAPPALNCDERAPGQRKWGKISIVRRGVSFIGLGLVWATNEIAASSTLLLDHSIPLNVMTVCNYDETCLHVYLWQLRVTLFLRRADLTNRMSN